MQLLLNSRVSGPRDCSELSTPRFEFGRMPAMSKSQTTAVRFLVDALEGLR